MTGMICVCLVRRVVMLNRSLGVLRMGGKFAIHLLGGVGIRLCLMERIVFDMSGD